MTRPKDRAADLRPVVAAIQQINACTLRVGDPVLVRRDDGSEMRTRVRQLPWVLGGRAVLMVDGISGAYALDRVRADVPSAPSALPDPQRCASTLAWACRQIEEMPLPMSSTREAEDGAVRMRVQVIALLRAAYDRAVRP
jgi:hypothetical protein